MEPMNLLVVERDADWSEWAVISRSLSTAVLMLVQQADETSSAFHDRISRRLARGKERALEKVVLLRNRKTHAVVDATSEALLQQLGASARQGLRVYPCAVTA
jgi:isochorismate synthase EntC